MLNWITSGTNMENGGSMAEASRGTGMEYRGDAVNVDRAQMLSGVARLMRAAMNEATFETTR